MIDIHDNTEEAQKFVTDKLLEVKALLDEIAEETGLVYVAMPSQTVSVIAQIGQKWATWLNETYPLIGDRLQMAAEHQAWMLNKYPETKEHKEESK